MNVRGFTMLEAAATFAIVGSLAAIAIPAFVRELHASKLTEAVEGVGSIAEGAARLAAGKPATSAFPASAPLTPSQVPRGQRVVDPPGTWDHPTWKALDFRASAEGVPHAFSFELETTTTGDRSQFVARAHGDLDGDGLTSTFEIKGHDVTGDAAGATIEPGLVVVDEVE